ncbi:MAG: prefoldin subunit alpha [Candidatus Diapherotrites archaeon]|nr:prefoldin subunit alpha [Candidatus Diapherotrites archaeon]
MAKEKTQNKEVRLSPQQLVSLYQNQRALMDNLLQQEAMMQEAAREIIGAEDALKEIDKAEEDANVLVLLGAGVFVEAKVKGKQVKSDIGSGVVENATVKKALEHLEIKKKNISANIAKLQKKKQETAAGLARLEGILQQVQKALAKKDTSPSSVS